MVTRLVTITKFCFLNLNHASWKASPPLWSKRDNIYQVQLPLCSSLFCESYICSIIWSSQQSMKYIYYYLYRWMKFVIFNFPGPAILWLPSPETFMYVYINIYTHVYSNICSPVDANIYTYVYMYIHTYIYICIYMC